MCGSVDEELQFYQSANGELCRVEGLVCGNQHKQIINST